MASIIKNTHFFSQIRSNSQKSRSLFTQPIRRFHIDLGEREKALLAKDPALSKFKSHKQGVKRMKRIGDVLTIIVAAGCFYEIYVRTIMREEARKNE